MFTYSKFYTHLKNNVKEGHDDVKVGFFFLNAETKQLCPIEKAWMEKEKHYEEFVIPENFELPVPLDNNLRSANPLVFVQTPVDMQCDYSLVVLTKTPLSGKVSYSEISQLLPQMTSMLADLGGMFSSWFTPDVVGLTLEFANQFNGVIAISDGRYIDIQDGKAIVELKDIPVDGTITLPSKTLRVLPYIPPKSK